MAEAEIYSTFYKGMTTKSKDLVNSSSGGSFSKLRVNEAKRLMEKLLHAKREYDYPQTLPSKKSVEESSKLRNNDQWESRLEKLEKAVLSTIEESKPKASPVKTSSATDQVDHHLNTTGLCISNKSWNPGSQRDARIGTHPGYQHALQTTWPNECQNEWNNWNDKDHVYQSSWSSDQPQLSFSTRNHPDPLPLNPYLVTTQLPPFPKDYQNYLYHPQHHYQTYQSPDHIHHYHPNQSDHHSHPYQIQPNCTYHP